MKKKIAIIATILLCVALICTFVACKKKPVDPEPDASTKYVVTDAEQASLKAEVEAYVDNWLFTHAEEEGNVTDQTLGLKADIEGQKNVFYFTATVDKTKKSVKMTNVKVKFNEADGTYDIDITYSDDKVLEKSVVISIKGKEAQTVKYGPWAGTKYSDSWIMDGNPSTAVDKIVEAAVNTANNVTGNAVTGKFSADGVVGINISGKEFGLRIVGNVDVTNKVGNQIGLVLLESIDVDADVIAGIYYVAAATADQSKLYIEFPSLGEDGKLVRENGKIVHGYKYIDYVDIYGILQKANALPAAKEKTAGALVYTDAEQNPIVIEGLESFLAAAFGIEDSSIATMVINMVTKAYLDKATGTYYVDINLGSVISQVSSLVSKLGSLDELSFLTDLNIDITNLSGLLGHITICATIGDVEVDEEEIPMLNGFELSVNIPKCTFYLNGERSTETEKNPKEFKLDIPAISFAIALKDFAFSTTETINFVPAGTREAVKFSPANLDLSGDVYVNHTQDGKDPYEATFHFDFVTDVNPFEIVANGSHSTAKGALVIKQTKNSKTFDENNCVNFLSVSYEQASQLLCMSGTALDMEDDGNTVYTATLNSSLYNVMQSWLGIKGDDWNGLTYDATNKKILIDEAHKDELYYSAGIIFNDEYVSGLINDIIALLAARDSKKDSGSATAETGFDVASIGDYFSDFKDLYDKYVDAKKIVVTVDPEFAFGADVSIEMINEVIGVINSTFGVTFDPITNPEYVKVFINTEDYKDKMYVTVKVNNNVFELTVDDSVAKTFAIEFKATLDGRAYTFAFTAVKSEDGTSWSASVTFDIQGKDDAAPVKHWEVGLSNYHGKWGTDNGTRVASLLPTESQKTAAQPIFPSDNVEKSVGNKLAQTLVDLLNKEEKVQDVIDWAIDLAA